ncbi:MAG: hypothetical protein IKP88_17190 [Lachnospiraceae bacterium]|nr:hypothetical protein [Lachnospiraceae bacterium]
MAKGSTMLKVVGIIMIVFGGIGIIISLLAFAGTAILSAAGVKMGIYYFACVVSLIAAVAELVTGILGVSNHNKPEKAQLLLICGIVVIVLAFLGDIILPIIAGTSASIVSFLLACVLPVLFIIGAMQNKNS